MAASIKQELHRMLEAISHNTRYDCDAGDLSILVDYRFYFDICEIVFPELRIQLIKYRDNEGLSSGDKMQKLINLLSRELSIDLSSIDGNEIVKSHALHVHQLLELLEQASEEYQNKSHNGSSRRVRSDPNTTDRLEKEPMASKSARDKVKKPIEDSENIEAQEVRERSASKKKSRRRPSYSAAKKEKRSRDKARQNLHSSLVKIIQKQKVRTMYASIRDNRKLKNQQIVEAKNKYKAYLLGYAKETRAQKNREQSIQKMISKKKRREESHQVQPLSDLKNIDGIFKSFQYRLRDQKYSYLKKVEKMIKSQEIDRLTYLNRIRKERNSQAKKSTKKQLERLDNQHRIRTNMYREQLNEERDAGRVRKNDLQKFLRVQKSELKSSQKKELDKIKDFIEQENQKVLVNLSEGNRLEQIILDMYKRF